jgi:hypothetical protein
MTADYQFRVIIRSGVAFSIEAMESLLKGKIEELRFREVSVELEAAGDLVRTVEDQLKGNIKKDGA